MKNIEMIILPRLADLGSFEVQRVLPFRKRQMIGPFIFWDQMGPGEFIKGQGLDVRPHPHIGLSTVTYLFSGSLDHKDSLGNDVRIIPGDINLMSAGSGIVHSERTGADIRQQASNLFGIQSWLAQPKDVENNPAQFSHTAANALPSFDMSGLSGRVLLGEFEGLHSPIPMQWSTVYVDLHLQQGHKMQCSPFTEERAIYLLDGELTIHGSCFTTPSMIVLSMGQELIIEATKTSHFLLLGGATMDGPRYIYWNFVSSMKERIEQAKTDWQERKFPLVVGDEQEFIPLPQ